MNKELSSGTETIISKVIKPGSGLRKPSTSEDKSWRKPTFP